MDIDEKLEETVAEAEQDLEWAEKKYEESLNKVKDRTVGEVDEEQLQQHALAMVRSDIIKSDRTGWSGESDVEEVEIVAIGRTDEMQWSTGDAVVAYGVVNPPNGEPRLGVFFCNRDESGAPLGEIKDKFRPLNSLKGWFSYYEPDEMPGVFSLNWEEESKIEEVDFGGQLSDREGRREFVHDHVDHVDLAEVDKNLSATNDDGRPSLFGGDMKMISGIVMERFVGEGSNGPFGIYKIMDDSVVDKTDLPEGVIGDQDRVPGLTCWCEPDSMEFGEDSQLELYGAIEETQEGPNKGQITMNVVGIVPIIATEPEEDDSSQSQANVKEEPI